LIGSASVGHAATIATPRGGRADLLGRAVPADNGAMTTQALEAQLAAKLRWAWDDGCPVAGFGEQRWADMAAIARRRWFSFERRRKKRMDDTRMGTGRKL
jgi:hypothetical protein